MPSVSASPTVIRTEAAAGMSLMRTLLLEASHHAPSPLSSPVQSAVALATVAYTTGNGTPLSAGLPHAARHRAAPPPALTLVAHGHALRAPLTEDSGRIAGPLAALTPPNRKRSRMYPNCLMKLKIPSS